MRFRKVFAALVPLVIGMGSTVHAQDAGTAELRAELEAMLASDQLYRGKEWRVVAEKFDPHSAENAAIVAKQNAIDDANIKRLGEIVERNGWPKRSVLGWKAASAAFAVVQHGSLADQQRFLPLVREAAANGEALPRNLAVLEDRILVREGKPQIYGSQIAVDPVTQKHSFHAIDDEANVDRRRAAVGLDPLVEYAKRLGFVYEPPKP